MTQIAHEFQVIEGGSSMGLPEEIEQPIGQPLSNLSNVSKQVVKKPFPPAAGAVRNFWFARLRLAEAAQVTISIRPMKAT